MQPAANRFDQEGPKSSGTPEYSSGELISLLDLWDRIRKLFQLYRDNIGFLIKASGPSVLPSNAMRQQNQPNPAIAAANALIKEANPEQTDDRIAYAIKVMNERGIVLSGDALSAGIGAMTKGRWQSFYQSMVELDVVPKGLDIGAAYTLDFVNKGIGKP